MGFKLDTSALSRALYDMEKRTMENCETYAHNAAKKLQSFAQAEAPWSDHTGHARGGITGTASRSGSKITITLSGSAHYLVYLELAHGKRWAVLWPTMQRHAPRILRGFARIGGLNA